MFNKKGYIGSSMSVRAKAAYESGEKPMSKWTKKTMIQEIYEEYDFNFEIELLEKLTLSTLKNELLEYASWHHINKFYKEVDFYQLKTEKIETLTDADIESMIQKQKEKQKNMRMLKKEIEILDLEINNGIVSLIYSTKGDNEEMQVQAEYDTKKELSIYTYTLNGSQPIIRTEHEPMSEFVEELKAYSDFDVVFDVYYNYMDSLDAIVKEHIRITLNELKEMSHYRIVDMLNKDDNIEYKGVLIGYNTHLKEFRTVVSSYGLCFEIGLNNALEEIE